MQDFKDNMKRLGTKNLQESETLNEQSTNSLLTEIRELLKELVRLQQRER
jgi:hypothetical protein